MKRGITEHNFLLTVDKPVGVTSHDVVNQLRAEYGEGRIGHMGTLDPMASGLLMIGVGQAARLNKFLTGHDKTYVVTASFGRATNTYDSEGTVTEEVTVPENFNIDVDKLKGKHKQKPPAFSAIKVNGKPAYVDARKGRNPDLPERDIEVYDSNLLSRKDNDFCIEVSVSSGTYIRSLIHDLGQELGVPAYVKTLHRSKIGDVSKCGKLNPVEVLGYKTVEADNDMYKRVMYGQEINSDIKDEYFSIVFDNKLIAIYKNNKPVSVFDKGIDL